MECIICYSSLIDKEKQISTTSCGHVYHHECITKWIRTKQNSQEKVCPNCRKVIDVNRNVIIYLGDEQMHQAKLEAKIADINTNLERQSKAFDGMMNVLIEQNAQLRTENLEIKDMLKNINQGDFLLGADGGDSKLKELVRAKEDTIIHLKKEIQDLKMQRAESAKHMEEIQKQVNELKVRQTGERGALKPVNNEAKQPISLSLKFDDFSSMDKADRLIFE